MDRIFSYLFLKCKHTVARGLVNDDFGLFQLFSKESHKNGEAMTLG